MDEEQGDKSAPPEAKEEESRATPPGPPPERASLRPSLPPSAGPGKNYRILFAALWIGAQVALVYTADRRNDGAFGFRMFSESSSIKVSLYREVGGAGRPTRVRVEGGVWSARSGDGMIRRFSWYDRVPTPYWLFDQEMHASYGAATQLSRLQGAVDDVAAHIPEDSETRRLVLEVVVRRNGRDPVTHQLTSRERISDGGREPLDINDGGP